PNPRHDCQSPLPGSSRNFATAKSPWTSCDCATTSTHGHGDAETSPAAGCSPTTATPSRPTTTTSERKPPHVRGHPRPAHPALLQRQPRQPRRAQIVLVRRNRTHPRVLTGVETRDP